MPDNKPLIIQVIEETSLLTKNVKCFSHGPKSYANLNQKDFPRIWLYPYTFTENYKKTGAALRTYTCVLDIMKLAKLNDKLTLINDVLFDTMNIRGEFMKRLAKHEKVLALITSLNEPLYHIYDDNLVGYGIKFDITLKEQDEYLCP